VTLCCETFGQPSDPTAALILGLDMQMVAWHDSFCEQAEPLRAGFRC
jgi:hypothetical protein